MLKSYLRVAWLVSTDSVAPVISGLAVGIAFILIFATLLKPVNQMTDDELRQIVSKQYPQVQALKERYVHTVEQIERYEWNTQMHYVATKEPIDNNPDEFFFPGPKVLAITLTFEPLSSRTISVICGSGLVSELPATIQSIKTTDCLETP